MTDGARGRESGVILVNVLVSLALASAMVVLMVTSQDNLLDRDRRASARSQAEALALGAETSVLVALRRDMREAPQTDHYAEAWAAVQQQDVELHTGRFSVRVDDAQGRLDLNGLAGGGIAQRQALARLVAALDLRPEVATRIATQMVREGPMDDIADSTDIDAAGRAALAPHVAFLPAGGAVNLNTADALVMGAVLNSMISAQRLVRVRERNGFLTPADLTAAGIVAGAGTGYRSDVFDATIEAEVDDVTVTLRSRLLRVRGVGVEEVRVVSRRFGPVTQGATLPELPPLH